MKKASLYRSHSPPVVTAPLCMGLVIYKVNHAIAATVNHSAQSLSVVKWILQSLPNGLWLFALLNFYMLLFRKHSFYQNLLWLTAITILGFTTEYLQFFHLVYGKFDILDLIFYEFACIATTYLAFVTQLKNLLLDIS